MSHLQLYLRQGRWPLIYCFRINAVLQERREFKAPSTRIRIFSNPQLFLCTVHPHPMSSTANPEEINPLSRVLKNKSATNQIMCGRVNPDIFESGDVKSVSSLSPNNKPIWRRDVEGEQSKFPATFSLYGACSEDI